MALPMNQGGYWFRTLAAGGTSPQYPTKLYDTTTATTTAASSLIASHREIEIVGIIPTTSPVSTRTATITDQAGTTDLVVIDVAAGADRKFYPIHKLWNGGIAAKTSNTELLFDVIWRPIIGQ